MSYFCPNEENPREPAWWRPLERFAERVALDTELPLVLPCEFMFMGRLDRRARPSIWEYKHFDTRRYLQIDDELCPYRYVPPKDPDRARRGRYVKRRGGLHEAVYHLDLWEIGGQYGDYCDDCERLVAVRSASECGAMRNVIRLREWPTDQ